MRILGLLLLLAIFFQGNDSVVSWDKTDHDFGELEYGKYTYATFVFTNVSNEPFTIDNVRTSCGCTAPFYPEREIPPQDTGHIVIEYDSNDIGEFGKWVKVYFSNQRKAEKLYVEGNVVE